MQLTISLKSLLMTLPAASLALALLVTTQPVQPANAQAPITGDAVRGAKVYQANCSGCHSLDANIVGPAHRGVFGRKAGSVKDFAYSPALKKASFAWDATRLDKWLTNPQAFVPGAKLGFRLSAPQRRADVIAYLKKESGQ